MSAHDRRPPSESGSTDAVSNNEKLFPLFQQLLATEDQTKYQNAARRFGIWLKSERAYYPEARPHIVTLLEVAERSVFRTLAGQTGLLPLSHYIANCPADKRQWFSSYNDLLNIVQPHLRLFLEPDLLQRIHSLLQRTGVSTALPSATVPPNGATGVAITQPIASTSTISESQRTGPVSRPNGPANGVAPSPASSILESNGNTHSTHSNQISISSSPIIISPIAPTAASPTRTQLVAPTPPQSVPPSVPSTTATSPAPPAKTTAPAKPRKKRKTAAISADLLNLDLDWLKRKGQTPRTNATPNNGLLLGHSADSPIPIDSPTLETRPLGAANNGERPASSSTPAAVNVDPTSSPLVVVGKSPFAPPIPEVVAPPLPPPTNATNPPATPSPQDEDVIMVAPPLPTEEPVPDPEPARISVPPDGAPPGHTNKTPPQMSSATLAASDVSPAVATPPPPRSPKNIPVDIGSSVKADDRLATNTDARASMPPDGAPLQQISTPRNVQTPARASSADTPPEMRVDAENATRPPVDSADLTSSPPVESHSAPDKSTVPSRAHIPSDDGRDVIANDQPESDGVIAPRVGQNGADSMAPPESAEVIPDGAITTDAIAAESQRVVGKEHAASDTPVAEAVRRANAGESMSVDRPESTALQEHGSTVMEQTPEVVTNAASEEVPDTAVEEVPSITIVESCDIATEEVPEVTTENAPVVAAEEIPPAAITLTTETLEGSEAATSKVTSTANSVFTRTKDGLEAMLPGAPSAAVALPSSSAIPSMVPTHELDVSPITRGVDPNTSRDVDSHELHAATTKPLHPTPASASPHPVSDPERSRPVVEPDPSHPIYGPEMVVLALQRGMPTCAKITLQFEINDVQATLLAAWNSRAKSSTSVAETLCLSLACYPTPDLITELSEHPAAGASAFGDRVRCTWPQRGEACMKVPARAWSIPLAPPFVLTPDNTLDLSPLLSVGTNTLHIQQRTGLEGYTFVLHAHHPTRRQIAAVQRVQARREKWKEGAGQVGHLRIDWVEVEAGLHAQVKEAQGL